MTEPTGRFSSFKEIVFMTPQTRSFFLGEEKTHQRLMAYSKLSLILALTMIDFLHLPNIKDIREFAYSIGINLSFLPIMLLQLWLSYQRFYWRLLKYVFLTIDVMMIVFFVITLNPFDVAYGTPAEKFELISFYKEQDMSILVLLYAWVLLNCSISFLVWFGICICAAWTTQYLHLLQIPGAFSTYDIPLALQKLPMNEIVLNPLFIDPGIFSYHIQLTIVLTIGLSFVIYSSRDMVLRFYRSQLQRNMLSRYFSPNIIEKLIAKGDDSLPRKKSKAAVLFIDIVGFTPLCQRISPDELMTMLQEFHGLLEDIVFKHGGTMEKYIGDALMASFGVPDEQDDAAFRANECAQDMLQKVAAWSEERIERGEEQINVGIGLSYGDTISGTIGHGRNMAFAVLGTTVNLASRLQNFTRDLDTKLIVNRAFYEQLKSGADHKKETDKFVEVPPVIVRGFSEPIEILILQP